MSVRLFLVALAGIVRRPLWARIVLPCLFVALVRPCADAGQTATRPASTRPAGITFMGVSTNAKSVVFVCDASGSMAEKKSTIREQLAATLEGMASDDLFDVVFMQQPDAADFSNELVSPTNATAEKLAQFCRDVEMSGATTPLPAIDSENGTGRLSLDLGCVAPQLAAGHPGFPGEYYSGLSKIQRVGTEPDRHI